MPKKTFGEPGVSMLRRMYSSFQANSAVSYFRPILRSSSSEPVCSGIWKCGWNFVPDAIQSMISSVIRFGSMLDMRYLSMPGTASSACSSSRKLSPVVRPKSPVFTPVSTISFTPSAAIFRAFSTHSAMGTLRLRPRA